MARRELIYAAAVIAWLAVPAVRHPPHRNGGKYYCGYECRTIDVGKYHRFHKERKYR